MSDVPVREAGSGIYRLAGQDAGAVRPTSVPKGSQSKIIDFESKRTAAVAPVSAAAHGAQPPSAVIWPHIVGLLLMFAACGLGAIALESWTAMTHWAGAPWTSESCRWVFVALLATTGVSFLQTRPIFFVISAAQCALAAYCIDVLSGGKPTHWIETALGAGRAPAAMAMIASSFGYLVYANPKSRVPSVRGVIGLLIVASAALGVSRGWFHWSEAARRIGPNAARVVADWGQEVTWATVLMVTAIGVSMSRSRPVHLLNALILAALACSCVKAGYSREVSFPELSTPAKEIKIDVESYANVDGWRWAVGVELGCLSAVLLHMSLGMGALSVVFALSWMVAGLSVYHTMGTLSLAKVFGQGTAMSAGGPLGNMGLPTDPAASSGVARGGMTLPAPPRSMSRQDEKEIAVIQREATVREVGTLAWMFVTSIFAGIIAVSGLRMISEDATYRSCATFMLWFVFLCGIFMLAWVWPRDPGQSWEEWVAAFKFSRYHKYLFWLAFIGSMSVAGIWALLLSKRTGTWIQGSVAAIILGTATSLVGAAVMIRFGGFRPLPVWVYCVLAAGQSSLAWALLFYLNPPVRRTAVSSS